MSEPVVLRRILRYLESHLNTSCSIDGLAHDFGMKRRGLYDFLGICSIFGICRRVPNNQVEWLGMSESVAALQAIRTQIRQENDFRGLKEIFNYSMESSLPKIALAVVQLFFVLKVKFLDLRKVSRLFAQRNMKYKTMLRKLYTIAGGLQLARIVRKTSTVSEIQLLVPFDLDSESPLKLGSMLNTPEELEEERTCELRRKEFDGVCLEFAHTKAVLQDRLPFPPPLRSLEPCV
jgi:hypothetical protein